MENSKMLNLINRFSWLALIGLVGYFFWSSKGCKQEEIQTERNKLENVKQRLTQTGPFLFWRGDTLDVHSAEASFMQYYEPQKLSYTQQEAINTIFYCATEDNEDKLQFKLHPITPQPSNYNMPEKLLFFGGNVSNFQKFKKALIGNGVIDKECNWTFGKGHLVIAESPIRSNENEFVYWLMYKLEQDAEKAGGKLHIVLGQNPFDKRKRDMNEKENFDVRPEFFQIQNWFTDTIFHENTEIGRWLYSKNVVENIGGYLILESGLNEDVIDGLPLDTINNIFRESTNSVKKESFKSFYLHKNFQKRLLKPHAFNDNYSFSDIVRGNIRYKKGDSSVNLGNNDSDRRVDRLLGLYKAKHIIGGFPNFKSHLSTANNNKFIGEIRDIKNQGQHSFSSNDSRYEGLLIENNQAFIVNDEGKKTLLFKE
jgi:hypothetical protein